MAKKETTATGAAPERYSVRCRFCGQKNAVKEDYKTAQPSAVAADCLYQTLSIKSLRI